MLYDTICRAVICYGGLVVFFTTCVFFARSLDERSPELRFLGTEDLLDCASANRFGRNSRIERDNNRSERPPVPKDMNFHTEKYIPKDSKHRLENLDGPRRENLDGDMSLLQGQRTI